MCRPTCEVVNRPSCLPVRWNEAVRPPPRYQPLPDTSYGPGNDQDQGDVHKAPRKLRQGVGRANSVDVEDQAYVQLPTGRAQLDQCPVWQCRGEEITPNAVPVARANMHADEAIA